MSADKTDRMVVAAPPQNTSVLQGMKPILEIKKQDDELNQEIRMDIDEEDSSPEQINLGPRWSSEEIQVFFESKSTTSENYSLKII